MIPAAPPSPSPDPAREEDVEELALLIRKNADVHALVRAHRETAHALLGADAPASRMIALRQQNLAAMRSSMEVPAAGGASSGLSPSLPSILQDMLYKSEEEALQTVQIARVHREAAAGLRAADASASRVIALRTENVAAMRQCMAFAPTSPADLRALLVRSEEQAEAEAGTGGGPSDLLDVGNNDSRNNPPMVIGGELGRRDGECDCSVTVGDDDNDIIWDNRKKGDELTQDFSTIPQYDKAQTSSDSESDYIGDLDSMDIVGDAIEFVDKNPPPHATESLNNVSESNGAHHVDVSNQNDILNSIYQPLPPEPLAVPADIAAYRLEGTQPVAGRPAAGVTHAIPAEILTQTGADDGISCVADDGNSCADATIATDLAVGVATIRTKLTPAAYYNALENRREDDDDGVHGITTPLSSPAPSPATRGMLSGDTLNNLVPPLDSTSVASKGSNQDSANLSDILASIYGQSEASLSTAAESSSSTATSARRATRENESKTSKEQEPPSSPLGARFSNDESNVNPSTKDAPREPRGSMDAVTEAVTEAVEAINEGALLDFGQANENDNDDSSAIVLHESASPLPSAIVHLMDVLSPFYGMAGRGNDAPPVAPAAATLGRRHSSDARGHVSRAPSADAGLGRRNTSDALVAHKTTDPPEKRDAKKTREAADPLLNLSSSEILSSIYGVEPPGLSASFAASGGSGEATDAPSADASPKKSDKKKRKKKEKEKERRRDGKRRSRKDKRASLPPPEGTDAAGPLSLPRPAQSAQLAGSDASARVEGRAPSGRRESTSTVDLLLKKTMDLASVKMSVSSQVYPPPPRFHEDDGSGAVAQEALPTTESKELSKDEVRLETRLKGIEYKQSSGTYRAKVYYRATIHHLGDYELACDAALAYDEAVRLLKGSKSDPAMTLNFKNKKDYLTLRALETKTRGVSVDLKAALAAMSSPIQEVATKIRREKSQGASSVSRPPPPSSTPLAAPKISSESSVASASVGSVVLPPLRYTTLNKNQSLQGSHNRSSRRIRRSSNDSGQHSSNRQPMKLAQKLAPDPPDPISSNNDGNYGGNIRTKDSFHSLHSSQGSASVSWAPGASGGRALEPPSTIHPGDTAVTSKVSGSLSDRDYVGSQSTEIESSHSAKGTKISKLSGSLSDHLYVGTQSTMPSTKDRSKHGSTLSTIRSESGSTLPSAKNQIAGDRAGRSHGGTALDHGNGTTALVSRGEIPEKNPDWGSWRRTSSSTAANRQIFPAKHSPISDSTSFEPSTIQSHSEDGDVEANTRKFKLSWSNESQSAAMTGRSMFSTTVAQTHNERDGSKAIDERLWASFAWILTFPIVNRCIPRPTKAAKQAWREKVALFFVMLASSVFCVGVLGFVPLLLCKEDIIFSERDIWLQTGESWVVIHGVIYDVKDFIYKHPGGVKSIIDFVGQDASRLIPRAPPALLPQKCLDMEKITALNMSSYHPENNFTNPTCPGIDDMDKLLGTSCHTFMAGNNGTYKFLGQYERGLLSLTAAELNKNNRHWFSLYDRVYDVTDYIIAVNKKRQWMNGELETNLDFNEAAYLTPTLNKVIVRSLGTDATNLYESLFGSAEYIGCLETMFYTGLLDEDFDTFCYALNIMMYCMLIFVSILMVVQFIASMIYICPRHRTYTDDDVKSPIMVKVPCYCEGDNELRKTIKSVFNTSYPDENKVLVMVADGLITGDGEDMSTPDHLANLLGFDIDEFEDDTFEYDCIGVVHTKNRARVYHGILQKGFKFLKYLVIVKCGLPKELTTSSKPGNRGKRDSQLIMIGFFNRIHYGRELTELDCAIQRAMMDLNLQADMIRFLMAIDADTRVDNMALTHMVYHMTKKEKVIALCGETKVDNKASSWVTMIQVFEYYSSHHLKKAFEAAFGCVTCLPGCFTMYRVIADDGTPLLPGDGVMYEYSRNDIETLHEKNLYHLGEDRLLTTLLLQYFPDRHLTFIPEAVCWTIVPHTFKILLSQRRRWINSTVHNMFELLRVKTLCGVSCVSMKVVVFIDLIATMILPASYIYAMFLLFLVFIDDLPVSTVLLILYAIMMGCQVAVFILRSRWEYIWWFFVYFTAGLPVFYFILPLWSFWNMDDFSWGKTRAVTGSLDAGGEGDKEEEQDGGHRKSHKEGYDSLDTDDTSAIPSVVRDDMHSTSVCSSIGQDTRQIL